MLEVRGIDAGYGEVQVLFSLSLSVNEKEIVTLLGSNGAGKTTTLRAITGVVPPRKGEVVFKGQSLAHAPAADRAGMGIALVPEGRELWPQLTVRENLELGAYHGRARARARENLDRVQSLFPRLLERKSQMAGSLAGARPDRGRSDVRGHPPAPCIGHDHPPGRAEPGGRARGGHPRVRDRDR